MAKTAAATGAGGTATRSDCGGGGGGGGGGSADARLEYYRTNADDVVVKEEREVWIEKDEFWVGRTPGSDLVMSEIVVSGKHCKFYRAHEAGKTRWFVLDNSTNGTFVNKVRVPKGHSRELHDGDEVTLSRNLPTKTVDKPPLGHGFRFFFARKSDREKRARNATPLAATPSKRARVDDGDSAALLVELGAMRDRYELREKQLAEQSEEVIKTLRLELTDARAQAEADQAAAAAARAAAQKAALAVEEERAAREEQKREHDKQLHELKNESEKLKMELAHATSASEARLAKADKEVAAACAERDEAVAHVAKLQTKLKRALERLGAQEDAAKRMAESRLQGRLAEAKEGVKYLQRKSEKVVSAAAALEERQREARQGLEKGLLALVSDYADSFKAHCDNLSAMAALDDSMVRRLTAVVASGEGNAEPQEMAANDSATQQQDELGDAESDAGGVKPAVVANASMPVTPAAADDRDSESETHPMGTFQGTMQSSHTGASSAAAAPPTIAEEVDEDQEADEHHEDQKTADDKHAQVEDGQHQHQHQHQHEQDEARQPTLPRADSGFPPPTVPPTVPPADDDNDDNDGKGDELANEDSGEADEVDTVVDGGGRAADDGPPPTMMDQDEDMQDMARDEDEQGSDTSGSVQMKEWS